MALNSLRALLIQKDVKPEKHNTFSEPCLRALLIQKDVKQFSVYIVTGKV